LTSFPIFAAQREAVRKCFTIMPTGFGTQVQVCDRTVVSWMDTGDNDTRKMCEQWIDRTVDILTGENVQDVQNVGTSE
jgi:hypothetical protein